MKKNKNNIGVMQGRLLPKFNERYQAHPVGYWEDEFFIAKKMGFDCIEFILDYNDVELNPLMSKNGIDMLSSIIDKSNVLVKTVCADYFMEAPLHSRNEQISNNSCEVLLNIIKNGSYIGLNSIVIPCVDQSSLKDGQSKEKLINNLKKIIPIAEKLNINLSLETDLPPQAFKKLLDAFESQIITVNYDIGNSAAMGYDPAEELSIYGDKISDIHIKDRVLGGASVELGKGAANFDMFFEALGKLKYTGPFIMQAYRDDEGIEILRKQFNWIKSRYLVEKWI